MPPTFASLSLAPSLLGVIAELGYTQPTPIQIAAIPPMLAGMDVVGQSRTGSGKTAAFALPILHRLQIDKRDVQALVICPTRELSSQVAREFRRLGRGLAGLTVVELIGGQRARLQKDALERGAHIAVGTPGRLLDLHNSGALDTQTIITLILDEADRMLDMGFGEQVMSLVRQLSPVRQTALFSATFPDSIATLSASCQRMPRRLKIDEPEGAQAEISQLRMTTRREDRFPALCSLLTTHPHESALIFCNFKSTVADVSRRLAGAGVSVDRLDGDLDQFHRDQVLARFRNQSIRLLIATDVAGRGIDVKGLDLVINYEVPQHPEIYVHRIGRTGRAGRKGVAISLTIDGQDERREAIEEMTGTPIAEITPEDLGDLDSHLRALARPAPMRTIQISGGRKNKVRPGDILGALTGEAGGLDGSQVGKIEVQAQLTYVAVEHSVCRAAVDCLNAGRIKGKRFRATLIGGSVARDGKTSRSW